MTTRPTRSDGTPVRLVMEIVARPYCVLNRGAQGIRVLLLLPYNVPADYLRQVPLGPQGSQVTPLEAQGALMSFTCSHLISCC